MKEKDKIEDIELTLLLEAIFLKYNYDFRKYSKASLKRRTHAAMAEMKIASISELQGLILHEASPFTKLLQYLTVPVTEMFRDPPYYNSIRTHVIGHLKTYPSLKIWVAGCSTGEEAYSLAILLEEEGLLNKVIIYATDINPISLEKAKQGIYNLLDIPKFTKNYQQSGGKRSFSDYYTVAYGAAAFLPKLREKILFTDHSLATDSVFSEVQFISCRNVLIYFEKDLQNRAVDLFHQSLAPEGFLGIGEKESLRFSAMADSFEEFDRGSRIYRKKLPGMAQIRSRYKGAGHGR